MSKQATAFRFKVTLREVRPTIWRRIEVPADCTFWDLHVAIQDAMGWQDCHLHVFRIAGPLRGQMALIGIPDDEGFEDEPETLPGWEVPVGGYLLAPGDIAVYEYDFGDGWEHEIRLEEIVPRIVGQKYPRCVGGERACPPEDCGGVPGYEDLLQTISDPSHEGYKGMMEWLGGRYDPEAFDPSAVRFDDPEERWRTAFERPG